MSVKPKIVNKNNQTVVRIQSAKGEQLSVREVDLLLRGSVSRLFPVKIVSKGKKHQLFFEVTGYIPLLNYLKSGLRKQHFATLLADVFYTLKNLQEQFFSVSAILLNHDFVFINPSTKEVYFIFIPIQLYSGGTSIRDFYLGFAEKTTFSQNENTEFVDEFLMILKRGINVSMFDIEEFIRKISVDTRAVSVRKRCKKCNAVNDSMVELCTSCGARMEELSEMINATYDPLQAVESVALSENLQSLKPVNNVWTSTAAKNALEEPQIRGWLKQKRTGKMFEIDKAVFRIGKSEDSDCYIFDNPVISRNHAEIRKRGNCFYAVDLFSTNKTFVDRKQLLAKEEVEILSGSIICFGNDEFEFQL